MTNLIDASTLTPAQRREVMPGCAWFFSVWWEGFKPDVVRADGQENGYRYLWRKPK